MLKVSDINVYKRQGRDDGGSTVLVFLYDENETLTLLRATLQGIVRGGYLSRIQRYPEYTTEPICVYD